MIGNIIQVLPKKLMRAVKQVKLKEGRHLNDKVLSDRGSHAMDSGNKQSDWPKVGGCVVPSRPAAMARGGSRLSTRGLPLYLYDPWLALLQVQIENDVNLVLDLGVLREHAPQQRAGTP